MYMHTTHINIRIPTYRHAFTGILIHIYNFHSFDLVGDQETGLTPRGVHYIYIYIYIHMFIYIYLHTDMYILIY